MYNLSFEWHIRSSGPLCSSRILWILWHFWASSWNMLHDTWCPHWHLSTSEMGTFQIHCTKINFWMSFAFAKSSNIESVKTVVIILLQRPVSAAAGFNSNHYFKLFGQTKSLPAPDTFCQLMVTTHQHGQRLDNHPLCLLLGRAAWSFCLGNFRVTSKGSREYRGLIQACPHLSHECTPHLSKHQLQ